MKMNDPNAFKALSDAIAGFSLSEENAQVGALESEIVSIRERISASEKRATELNQQIRDYSGPDPEAIADALMQEVSPAEAAALGVSKEELVTEHKSLRSAIGRLNDRIRDRQLQIDEVRRVAGSKFTKVARPFVDEVAKTQTRAAEDLISAYAAIRLLNDIGRQFTAEETRSREAVTGVMSGSGIIAHRRDIEVPLELIEALKPIDEAGPALRGKVRDVIRWW